MPSHRHILITLLISATLFACATQAVAAEPRPPSGNITCPVCGMYVAKYPDWVAQIHFTDGPTIWFDGPKDMFKYLFDMKKYAQGRVKEDIVAIYVTEYYDTVPLAANKAWYVIGSDVYGPMGKELVPLATREDALTFLRDHKGTRVLRFEDVTPTIIEELG